MEDTLEKPNSPPNILSQDQSTSPVIPDRAMVIEFENSTKSKGDIIRSMNETFSTVKENPILETDADNKDDQKIFQHADTLTEIQVKQNQIPSNPVAEIDLQEPSNDAQKKAEAISKELQELHQNVRKSLVSNKKSLLSEAENEITSRMSMLTEEQEIMAQQHKQKVEIKSSRSKKIDGNESYAVSGQGSVKPVKENQDPPQLADVDTNYGNAQETSRQTTQRAQLTPRQFSREREPIKGKLLKKRLFDRERSIVNSSDYNTDLIQVTGQKAALSPQNPQTGKSINLNKNFIQIQLKTKSPEHLIPDPSTQNKNAALNKPNPQKKGYDSKVTHTREGSRNFEEPVTPVSSSTVPAVNDDSKNVTPAGLGKNTVILYQTKNMKGTRQTRTKQTNMNIIAQEQQRQHDISQSPEFNAGNMVGSIRQDNLKQQILMDKKVNVLMPTQYNSGAIIKPQDSKFHHGNLNTKNAKIMQHQHPSFKLPKSREFSKNNSRSPSIQQAQQMPFPSDFIGQEVPKQVKFSSTIFGNKRRTQQVSYENSEKQSQETTPADSYKMQRYYKVQSLTIDFNEQQEQTKKVIQQRLAKTQSITDNTMEEKSPGLPKSHEIPAIAISPGQPKLGDYQEENVMSTTVIGKNSSIANYEKLGNGQPKLESKLIKKAEEAKTLYPTNANNIEFQAPKQRNGDQMNSFHATGGDDYHEKRSALRSQGVPNSIQIKLNRRNKINQNQKAQELGQPGIYGSGIMQKESEKLVLKTKSGSSNPHDSQVSQDNPQKDPLAITLPNLIPHPGVSTKSFSKHALKVNQGVSSKRNKRQANVTMRQNSSDYKELPIHHKNAFQNSFYNKEIDRMITKQTMSKQSLVFSINNQTDDGGRTKNSIVGGSPLRTMPNIDMKHFQMPRIKINNAEASKLMTDSVQSIDKQKNSHPLSQNTAEFKTELGAWSPHVADHDQDLNKVYFEQPEQLLTNKQNYYYKQIRNLEKGQQIVISHPYDMSHMANTQKSFLTQQIKSMNRAREAVKTAGNLPKNMRNFNRFSEATPRERKDEWIRRAQMAQEAKIINSNDAHLISQAVKGQIKGLPQDHVVPQDQVLQIDKLKMFDKSQEQGRAHTVEAERSKSQSKVTPKDSQRADGTLPFPNRQTPKNLMEDQVSGERRDVVNIHQQLQLKTIPVKIVNEKPTKFEQIKTQKIDLKASIGIGSYDINNSSRLRQINNDANINKSLDKKSNIIKTARSSEPMAQENLAKQLQNISQKRNSQHNNSMEDQNVILNEGKFPTEIKIQKQSNQGNKLTAHEKHNFSFRNVMGKTMDSNTQFMNFQNQKETLRASQKTYENNRTSNATSSPRNTEKQPQSYREFNESQNKGRLVAYSSLGMAKLSQYKNSSVASGNQISNRSKSPNHRRDSQKDNSPSPKSHQSSYNNPSQSGRGRQRSIFFNNPVKFIQSNSKNQKENQIQKGEQVQKNQQQEDSKEYTQEPEMNDNRNHMKEHSLIQNSQYDYQHQISQQQSSVNRSQRSQSPTLYTGKIKSLGRKQVSGFAGGVIGSAINPKAYHLRSIKKSEEVSQERNSVDSQDGPRQDNINVERTLSIDSPVEQAHRTKKDHGQKTFQVHQVKTQSIPPVPNTISLSIPNKAQQTQGFKIQLTQRNSTNSNLSPTDQQAILMGGNSVSDRNQITSNTQRSFKMDDILYELNCQQSNSSQSHLHQTDKSNRSKKYQPLNMKEIQLQHSARINQVQDYATLFQKDKAQMEWNRRKSQSIVTSKKRSYQDQNARRGNVKIQGDFQDDYNFPQKNLLDPQLVEFLRQKTLYKMQVQLWKAYEEEWGKFKNGDHLNSQAPIPPCCRILTLHVFLTRSNKDITQMKNDLEFLMGGQELFKECFKEAKRRLQMCSFRIIDENVFLDMKQDMTQGFQIIMPFYDVKFPNHAHSVSLNKKSNLVIESGSAGTGSENKARQTSINDDIGGFGVVQTLENIQNENSVAAVGGLEDKSLNSVDFITKKSVILDTTTVHDINEVDEDGGDK